MSQDHQGMTSAGWMSYMANVAAQHRDLQHGVNGRKAFARMVLTEAMEQRYTQLDDTAMLVEMYEEEGLDNLSNNLMSRHFLAWHIIKRLSGQNNDTEQAITCERECQLIAKQVLARLRHDRLNYADQRFANVKMTGWRGDSSTALFGTKWAGWRIEVEVEHVDRELIYSAGYWDDDVEAPVPDEEPCGCNDCHQVKVCGTATDGQVPQWDADTNTWVPGTIDTSASAGGLFTWDAVLGLLYTRDGVVYQVQLNQQ